MATSLVHLSLFGNLGMWSSYSDCQFLADEVRWASMMTLVALTLVEY